MGFTAIHFRDIHFADIDFRDTYHAMPAYKTMPDLVQSHVPPRLGTETA